MTDFKTFVATSVGVVMGCLWGSADTAFLMWRGHSPLPAVLVPLGGVLIGTVLGMVWYLAPSRTVHEEMRTKPIADDPED